MPKKISPICYFRLLWNPSGLLWLYFRCSLVLASLVPPVPASFEIPLAPLWSQHTQPLLVARLVFASWQLLRPAVATLWPAWLLLLQQELVQTERSAQKNNILQHLHRAMH